MSAYYNEIDPAAAQWLRNLISAGLIAPGDVDERSIEDVIPGDLAGYTQCHFFAGIGVWSYALRRAGWDDSRPVWTGSCPCQPFSSAGTQAGFDDERHLWPHFQWLIEQCRPTVVFGEQVASKAVDPWIDLVQTDLEALGYAFGGVPFPSAGVGAPHIRDRLFWVADRHGERFDRIDAPVRPREVSDAEAVRCSQADDHQPGVFGGICGVSEESVGLANTELQQRPDGQSKFSNDNDTPGRDEDSAAITRFRGDMRTGPTNGFWADADWLLCRDGRWRPVEPGSFPLVDGSSARVVRLRAYGNAINAEAAREFIGSVMECIG